MKCRYFKKIFSFVIAGSMVLTSFPVSAAPASETDLKEQMRSSVSDEDYPNGLVGFGETQLTVIEGEKKTITVFRQGNTDKEATVRFKAIDVSAEYGSDYLLTVVHSGLKKEQLDANENAVPLMQQSVVAGDTAETSVIVEDEEAKDAASANKGDTTSKTSTSKTSNSKSGKKSGLQAAYQAQMNEEAPTNDWTESNPETTPDEVKDTMTEGNEQALSYFENAEGQESVITFKKGEYQKDIIVETLDDSKSESEEQFVFVLCDAEGTEIGPDYNGYFNISDDEEAVDNVFAVKDKEIVVSPDEDTAKVTIVRTNGIDQLAFVTVGTKSVDAVPNVDYESVVEELIFPAGVTEKTVEVPIIGDRTADRQFYVGISEEGVVREKDNYATLVTISKFADSVEAVVAEDSITAAGGPYDVSISNRNWFRNSWVAGPIDLRLADSIKVEFTVKGQRITYHEEGSCKNKHTVADYHRSKKVNFVVAKNQQTSDRDILTGASATYNSESNNGYLQYTRDIDKEFNKWKDLSSAYLWVGSNPQGSNDSSSVLISRITVHYPDYTFIINNNSDYNYYQEIRYTGSTTSAKNGDDINLGKAYFDGDSKNIKKTTDKGSLNLNYMYSGKKNSAGIPASANTVSFKGYRLKRKNSSNSWSEPDMLSGGLSYEFIKKYRDNYMSNGHTFELTPAFEVKSATVDFSNANAKVGNTQNAKGNYKGYSKSVNLKKLDTMSISASSNSGYAVDAIGLKSNDNRFSTSNKDIDGNDKSTFVTGLGNTDSTKYTAFINYDTAKVKVMADPKMRDTDSAKQGIVLYIDENKNVYKASLSKELAGEDTKDSFDIEKVNMNQTYSLIGTAQEGYSPVWRDGTLDDKETGEGYPEANSSYKSFTPVQGSVLPYTTKISLGRVYYSFQLQQEVGDPTDIYGFVKIRDRYILGNEVFDKGINGANVTINGNQVQTTTGGTNKNNKDDGFFRVKDNSFSVLNYYLVNVNAYGEEGSINTSFVMNPGMVGKCIIDTKDDLTISNAKVYLKGKDGKYVEQQITHDEEGMYSALNNGDRDIRIEMRADKSGVSMKSAKLQFYDVDGKKLDKDVAGTSFGDADNGYFRFDFNPKKLEIPTGATLRVVFTDNQDHAYLQRELGMSLCESIGNLDFANSFTFGGANTVIKMVGKIDSAFDFGWNGDFDDTLGEHVANDPTTGDKVITVGFKKEVINKTENRSNIQKAAATLAEKDQAIANTNKELSKCKDADKKKELKEKLDKANKEKQEAQNKYKETAKTAQDPKKTQTTLGGNANLSVGFSFVMVFGKESSGKNAGKFYFKSMTLTATVEGGFNATVSFATPIGITINLGFGAGGNGSATFIVEQRRDQRYPEKYYITSLKNSNGSIDIFDCNMNNAERKFDGYGVFELNPYITISLGAGVLGKLIEVTVSGKAQFNMQFYTTAKENNGSVNLSADLTVKVLMITHTWNLASTNVNLFGNSGSASLGNSQNYLYEPADVMQAQDIGYMKGGTKWKSGKISAKSIDESEDGYVEKSIGNKIAENPDFRMVKLGAEKYVAVFTNVDPARENALNAKAIYYTTYNKTDGWSEPKLIENDKTLDQDPNIFDLGDRGAVITWSSADKVFTDETSKVDMQNSMNLHCVFVDKSGKLSDIQKITKTTTVADAGKYADATADVAANVSYNDKSMIVYYQKKEYEPQEDGKEYLGDVLFPSVTVMAARTYDFTSNKWDDSYKRTDLAKLSDDEFTQYTAGFYGQEFFDFLPQIELNEQLDDNGYWADNKEPEIKVLNEADANKALIVDTDAMSYNDLGVFAYTIDRDGDMNTNADRDVYMQIYDFTSDSFMHPIVVNNDTVEDKNVRFVRVKNTTFLTWLHNGDIQALDMSNIIHNYKTLLKKGEGDYYYIDKTLPANWNTTDVDMYIPPITIVEGEKAEADNAVSAISDFDVQASDEFVYFVWSQIGASLKEGVEEGGAEALDPANTLTESQLYTARYDLTKHVKTKPVQITSKVGANYSSVAFEVEGDKLIGLAYKADSKIVTLEEYNKSLEENNQNAAKGKGSNGAGIEDNEAIEPLTEDEYVPYSVPDYENAMPYTFTVDPKSVVKIKNAGFTENLIAGTDAMVKFDILNDGVETVTGMTLTAEDESGRSVLQKTVLSKDDEGDSTGFIAEDEYTDSIALNNLIGGDSITASALIAIPEDADKTGLTITVTDKDGKVVAQEKLSETIESQLSVHDLIVEETDVRDKFKVTGKISNIGGRIEEGGAAQIGYDVSGESNKVAEIEYPELRPGDTTEFEKTITLDSAKAFTSETDDEGNVTDTAVVYVEADSGYGTKDIVRAVDADQMKIVNAVKKVGLEGTKDGVLEILPGDTAILTPKFTSDLANDKSGATGAEGLQYHFVSEDEDIVSVENGGLATGMNVGETTIKMYAYPKDSEFVADNQDGEETVGIIGAYEDEYLKAPKSAIIEKKFKVAVVEELSTPDNPTPDNPAPDNPTPDNPAPDNPTPDNPTPASTEAQTDNTTPQTPTDTTTPQTPTDTSKVTVDGGVYTVTAEDQVTYTASETADQKTVTVPATITAADGKVYKVTSVAAEAFKDNAKVKSVVLGKNVVKVEKDAFSGCSNLTKVTLDKNLTTIAEGAFRNCKKLKSVTIPKNVTSIGKNTFAGCSKLKTVYVKTTKLKKIGKNAFSNINSKAKFKLSGNSKKKKAVKKLFTKSVGIKKTMTVK